MYQRPQRAAPQTKVGEWINGYLQANTPRARSLVITLLGDTVVAYRKRIWAGDLIALLAPLGINERLVRTSLYRLSEAGWLTSQRSGRRSHYTLVPSGQRRFEQAYARVYSRPADWNGNWTMVVAPKNLDATDRNQLQRELEWEGFATAATGVFMRPENDTAAAGDAIESTHLEQQVAVFEARDAAVNGSQALASLVARSWALEPVAQAYADFNRHFMPLRGLINSGDTLQPEQAFVIQTLMIDAFRWATLKDPHLPAALLPADWPGRVARQLCAGMYQKLIDLSRDHLAQVLGIEIAEIPAAITNRFHGLAQA